jgi:hypothetical protein
MELGNRIKKSLVKQELMNVGIWLSNDNINTIIVREKTWIEVSRNTFYDRTIDDSNNLRIEFNPRPRIPIRELVRTNMRTFTINNT